MEEYIQYKKDRFEIKLPIKNYWNDVKMITINLNKLAYVMITIIGLKPVVLILSLKVN